MHDAPPLAGLKVIDAGSFIAAPAAATVMADLGAKVIKLEPPAGDPFRNIRRAPGNPPCEVDYGWLADNRNKRGLALDLKTEAGRGALYRLIRNTDVFVTNLPLAARERLGIGYEELSAHNERLVYASLTAYGEHEVSYGVITTLRDIPEDRQMRESGALAAIDDPAAGARYVVSSPLWIDGAPRAKPSRPPAVGEHSAEILREHDFSPEEIEALRRAGAIPDAAATTTPAPGPA